MTDEGGTLDSAIRTRQYWHTFPVRSLCDRIEELVDPASEDDRRVLDRLDSFIGEVLDPAEGTRLEASGELPRERVREFARRGLADEITGSWPRLMRVCTRVAAHDVELALVLGGAVLGGIPLLVSGSEAQRAAYFGALRRGELGGLALSEPDHGSDLLSNECSATPRDGGFRITGVKGPVNNGSVGAFLVVLARTSPEIDPFAHSLFLVARDDPGSIVATRLPTVGHRNIDLATVRFDDVAVGADRLIGDLGGGFHVVRQALSISRSGVAAQALGPMTTCLSLMRAHAERRRLYGSDLHALGAVRELMGRSFARTVLSAALVRRAARTVAPPESQPGWTSAAKYFVPTALEEVVHDTGTLLGATGILEHPIFSRVRRAAPTFAVFDGSSQLQLDELWRHCLAWRSLDDETSPLFTLSRAGDRFATIVELGTKLPDWSAAHRDGEQRARFAIGRALADVYALGALAGAPGSSATHAVAGAWLAEIAPRLAATAIAFGDEALAHRLLEPAKRASWDAVHAELR